MTQRKTDNPYGYVKLAIVPTILDKRPVRFTCNDVRKWHPEFSRAQASDALRYLARLCMIHVARRGKAGKGHLTTYAA